MAADTDPAPRALSTGCSMLRRACEIGEPLFRLRTELGKSQHFEFHFRDNSHADRITFLDAVAPYPFTYHAVMLEKASPVGVEGEDLYLHAVTHACLLADAALDQALLIVDGETRSRPARRRLAGTLRQRVNGAAGRRMVAEVRVQESRRNDLLQLADFAAGIAARWARDKRGGDEYRRLLTKREGIYFTGQI